ncbi:Zinc finger CCCH-type domain containing protein 8-like protein [Camelus ferus]|nr:Zinc finger CCCH-type domain containing protein 8-like protein [Camelus ferus]
MMDFENLFSKPPNPALGKKPITDSDERIDGEIDGTEVEETQEEKIKWKVKLECEQIPKKFRHFGNSTSPKNLQHRKSRSKDYDVYSDDDICSQESEDSFAKELQQYIQAKEMANVAQSLSLPEESVKKEGAKNTQKAVKQKNKNKNLKKNGKQKKMKRKWPGAGDKGPNASLRNRGSQEQDGKPKEKQQPVIMSQGFINQHTVQRHGKQICKYFLERKCIKGDQCKFDHDAEIEKKKEMFRAGFPVCRCSHAATVYLPESRSICPPRCGCSESGRLSHTKLQCPLPSAPLGFRLGGKSYDP